MGIAQAIGVNALDLSDAPVFRAIIWPYKEGGDQFLISIKPSIGEIVDRKKLPVDTSLYFSKNGTMLVSTSAQLIDAKNVQQVGTVEPT